MEAFKINVFFILLYLENYPQRAEYLILVNYYDLGSPQQFFECYVEVLVSGDRNLQNKGRSE